MKIKEVSEIVGVSKRTLQYYDDINLVKARRLKNNHREYDESHLDILWRVLFLKEVGLKLGEIKGIIAGEDMEASLLERIKTLDENIESLRQKKKLILGILEKGILPKDDQRINYLKWIKNYEKL